MFFLSWFERSFDINLITIKFWVVNNLCPNLAANPTLFCLFLLLLPCMTKQMYLDYVYI